jgi:two-component system KDP operon response regulator KdpE
MTDPMLRVLLVEDEALNRALVKAVIGRSVDLVDVELVEAATIADARRVLSEGAIDILLLDVRLPDGSGLDLAGELRRSRAAEAGRRHVDPGLRPAHANLPLIAILSASVLANEREAALAAGADEFLGKPFAPGDLVDLLQRFRDRVRRQN